jgi:hypothetical protein
MISQTSQRAGIQAEATSLVRLRILLDRTCLAHYDASGDDERAGVEVDVLPAKGQDLAATRTRRCGAEDERG